MPSKAKHIDVEEIQNSFKLYQSSLVEHLIQERFHKILHHCNSQDTGRKVEEKNDQKFAKTPKKVKTDISNEVKKLDTEISTQVVNQKKRPISQMTMVPTKNFSKLKKF